MVKCGIPFHRLKYINMIAIELLLFVYNIRFESNALLKLKFIFHISSKQLYYKIK